MLNDRQSERDLFRDALGPGPDCPPVQALERLLNAGTQAAPPAALAQHVEACAHCRTELDLLRSFQSAEVRPDEERAVREVTERLRSRSKEIFGGPVAPTRQPWWKTWLSPRSYRTATLAFAAAVGILAVGMQLRHSGPPALGPVTGSGEEVLRSNAIAIVAPAGDLQKAPERIQWRAAAGAVKYVVRLLEVDRTEMWQAETVGNSIALPSGVQARIVPAKTILCQVRAFDASGRMVAESELVRFRLLQNVYGR